MKIPRKTVEVYDWERLWELLKAGQPIHLEDMDMAANRAFNTWARNHRGVHIKASLEPAGGYLVTLGSEVPQEKRRPPKPRPS